MIKATFFSPVSQIIYPSFKRGKLVNKIGFNIKRKTGMVIYYRLFLFQGFVKPVHLL